MRNLPIHHAKSPPGRLLHAAGVPPPPRRGLAPGRLSTAGSILCWAVLTPLIGGLAFAQSPTAVWTGLGSDDYWANPDNWLNGHLPTASDDIAFDSANWQDPTRCTTVTVAARAEANKLWFYQYGSLPKPFSHIKIVPGGELLLYEEFVDQSNMNPFSGYTQTGGSHTVTTDFSYHSHGGHFEMTAGELTVGGTLSLRPEHGTVTIHGGVVHTGQLNLRSWENSYNIESGTTVHVHEQAVIGGELYSRTMNLGGTFHMHGADFVNEFGPYERPWCAQRVDMTELNLIFEGGAGSISTCDVAGADYGVDLAGFVDNFAVGAVALTDPISLVRLLGQVEEVLYVDALEIDLESQLDLNGHTVYVRDAVMLDGIEYYATAGYHEFSPPGYEGLIDSNGGASVILIPDPSALALLALCSVIGCWRRS